MRKELTLSYEYFESWKELSEDDQELVNRALHVMDSAYAPYSNFKVGTSLRLSNKHIINGSNQENVAFPSGLCAERVALFYAGANYPDLSVSTLCVVASGDLLPQDKLLSPCGGCRQVMMETESRQGKNIRVILVSQNNSVVVFNNAKSLLPLAFGAE
ncbi:MAG: cytidine deaminase [Crocinitomicaceae bacterium]